MRSQPFLLFRRKYRRPGIFEQIILHKKNKARFYIFRGEIYRQPPPDLGKGKRPVEKRQEVPLELAEGMTLQLDPAAVRNKVQDFAALIIRG